MATTTITVGSASRLIVTYTTTATNDTYTIKITNVEYKYVGDNSTGTEHPYIIDVMLNDNMSSSVNSKVYEYSFDNITFRIAQSTKSKSVNNADRIVSLYKTTSAQSVPIEIYVSMERGGVVYSEGSKTITFTVPALARYTVSYNANGGSGAPSSQTKWYGTAITLSSTRPTRTNYQFLGWATSAGATTAAYQPGGAYSANASATLFAVWRQVYASPSLTINRSYRCDSSGNVKDEGAYAAIELKWSIYNTGSNAVQSLSATVNGVTATATPSGLSGTKTFIVAAAMTSENSYAVSASITDAGCATSGVTDSSSTTTRTDSISEAYFPIDFLAGGHGVGIGTPATESEVLRVAHSIRMLDSGGNTTAYVNQANGNVMASGMAGMVQMFAGSTAPTGWLICDGSAVSRTTYATLFAVIGTTWGAGNGSTTFNLPDLRGRGPIGAGTGSGLTSRTLGGKGGSEYIQAHTHSFTQPTISVKYTACVASGNQNAPKYTGTSTTTALASASGGAVGAVSGASTGTSGNMQPFAVINFIICTGKTS